MLDEIGFASALRVFSGERSWKLSTITTTLHGGRGIMVKICGSYEKVRHQLSQVRKGLSVVLWATYLSYWKELRAMHPELPYTPRYTELVVRWEELKLKENSTSGVMLFELGRSVKKIIKLGCKEPTSKSEGETSMKARLLISE
jgi:hypothetical protein